MTVRLPVVTMVVIVIVIVMVLELIRCTHAAVLNSAGALLADLDAG